MSGGFGLDFAGAAAQWLAGQDPGAVRTAREIIRRREAERALPYGDAGSPADRARIRESGFIQGLELALSYQSARPGDISMTGAGGFISAVEDSDRLIAGAQPGGRP